MILPHQGEMQDDPCPTGSIENLSCDIDIALASRTTYCNNDVIQNKVPVPVLDTSMITLITIRPGWCSKKNLRLIIVRLADRVQVV